jgi:hypothetical protein
LTAVTPTLTVAVLMPPWPSVGVVAQQLRCGVGDGGVFGGAEAVVVGHWEIVTVKTLTVAMLMPPWPSEMVTVKLSEPLKLLPGV